MAVVYGPNFWTGGSFTVTQPPETSIAGYPEAVWIEDCFTDAGGGPTGQTSLDSTDYAVGAFTFWNFGPEAGDFWDLRGDDDGPGYYYGCWVKYSSQSESETGGDGYAFAFGIRRVSPSEGFNQVFALRVGDGGLHIRENGSETTVHSIAHNDSWHYVLVYINPSSDEGFTGDGTITVWEDGVQVFTKTDSFIWADTSFGTPSFFCNYVSHGRYGLVPVTGFTIYSGSSNQPPVNESTPCCADGHDPGGPGGTPGDVLGPDPYAPITEWSRQCAGGGTVPQAADQTDSESWVV